MQTYKLTATLAGKSERRTIEAENDSLAMLEATGLILDLGYQSANAWAIGAIELEAPSGEIIATMSAK